VDPVSRETTKRKRCRPDSKAVNAACVRKAVVVSVDVPLVLQDELSYARDYLVVLPERIREVQEAADAVLKAGGNL
jgi:hypothetical protein